MDERTRRLIRYAGTGRIHMPPPRPALPEWVKGLWILLLVASLATLVPAAIFEIIG